MEKIDTKLIKILKSESTNKDLISNIKYLINANVLNHIETQLCEKVLEQIELIGIPDLEGALKQLNINYDDLNNILGYEKLKILEKIDDLILLRKEKENKKIQSMALKKVSKGIIDKETTDVFLNRYVEAIHIKENNVLEKLITLKDEESVIDISTGSIITDHIIGGLGNGTITTITGNKVYSTENGNLKNVTADYKELWAINIAYKALQSGKNVLYIALGKTDANIYLSLLSKHSCNSNFDRPLTKLDLFSKKEKVKDILIPVYEDFKSKYKNHLIVFDERQFDISTHHNLQRLFAYSENDFKTKTKKGIDLIIIDDFTYMKLETNKRSIINKNIIANDYYKYLRNQSKNFLGTGKSIPILITIDPVDSGIGASKNVGNYLLEFLLYEVQALSDNILTIFGSDYLDKVHNVKIQIIKSKKGIMSEATSIIADIDYCSMEDDIDYADCPISEGCLISQMLKEDMSVLKIENERLKNQLNEVHSKQEPISIEI